VTQDRSRVDLHEVRQRAVTAARAAAAKVGAGTVILEVGAVLAITDYFVITSGANARQVRTIAEEVEASLSGSAGIKPLRVEGLDDARWVLIDYGDFVVHVFLEEVRRYYDIERLWSDAPRVEWEAEDEEVADAEDEARTVVST
jgi:ribosome-associated protein